jgi:aquaporin Z
METGKTCAAEAFGTFWLVLGGCGSAVFSAAFPTLGIGFVGVALAFGLSLLTMAYAVGPVSGAHLNPAVSLGAWVAGRLTVRELGLYVGSQLGGAILASTILYLIASGQPDFSLSQGFAANGYGAHSPGGYGVGAAFLMELVLTGGFVFTVLSVTAPDRSKESSAHAPLAVGFALALVHLVGIPVTNVSVNPARSTAPALFVGGWALGQLWLFWIAPLLGSVLAGLGHMLLTSAKPAGGRQAWRARLQPAHSSV